MVAGHAPGATSSIITPIRRCPQTLKIILKYLLLLRVFAIGGQLLALGAMHWVFGLSVPLLPVVSVLCATLSFTLWSWYRFTARQDVGQGEFAIQLVVDIMALTVLVFFTGGSANPFISLFILPIVFAAAAFSPLYTAGLALLALVCYTLLMFFYEPLAQHHLHVSGVDLHMWGMWYGFLLSAAAVSAFVAKISRTMRERDKALASAREMALRAERIVALGTLAAGTAHELGTPLSTMAVIAKELELDLTEHPELKQSVVLLRTQIQRCKTILAQLATDAGAAPAAEGRRETVPDFLEHLIAEWRALRPEVDVRWTTESRAAPPQIVADRTLRQAIMNVLNNAADAATHSIDVAGGWDRELLTLEIRDDGPGIAARLLHGLGREVGSTKGERGLGIGLYLANTVIERIGGRVEIHNRQEGGARARIEIPLAALVPAA